MTVALSILKTITYRIQATLVTIGIVYAFTGKFMLAIEVGGIEVIAKLVSYYVHERVWVRILRWKKFS